MSCVLLLIDQFVFIFTKLSLDHFFYKIDRYVHIRTYFLRTDDAALHRNRNLDLLTVLFRAERYMNLCTV